MAFATTVLHVLSKTIATVNHSCMSARIGCTVRYYQWIKYNYVSQPQCSPSLYESITIHLSAASTIQSEYADRCIGGAPPSSISNLKQFLRSIASTHSLPISKPPRSASTCLSILAASFSSSICCRLSSISPSLLSSLWSTSNSRDTKAA